MRQGGGWTIARWRRWLIGFRASYLFLRDQISERLADKGEERQVSCPPCSLGFHPADDVALIARRSASIACRFDGLSPPAPHFCILGGTDDRPFPDLGHAFLLGIFLEADVLATPFPSSYTSSGRDVAKLGHRVCFGSRRPRVRIPPSRPPEAKARGAVPRPFFHARPRILPPPGNECASFRRRHPARPCSLEGGGRSSRQCLRRPPNR